MDVNEPIMDLDWSLTITTKQTNVFSRSPISLISGACQSIVLHGVAAHHKIMYKLYKHT